MLQKTLLSIFTLTLSFAVFAQDSSIDDKIKRLMEVTGGKKSFDVVIENMVELQKESFYEIFGDYSSNEFFDEFKKEVQEEGFNDIVELLIPVYKKYITEEELDAVIKFYESDAGKSFIEKQPIIVQESMTIGAEWGEQLAIKIQDKMANSKELNFRKNLDEDCSMFKEGNFFLYMPDSSIVEIERKGNLQIEKIDGKEYQWKIEWLKDCRYTMERINTGKDNKLDDNVLEVNIYEINENSYKYISHSDSYQDLYDQGEIIKKE